MYYQPNQVMLLTVDAQGLHLNDPQALTEMQALHDRCDTAGVTMAQCGMRWDGSGFGDTVQYCSEKYNQPLWRPLIRLLRGEFWSGKTESDGTSNSALVDFAASRRPAVILIQGRAINDCAANTGCGLKRELRKLGITADVVLALDSACEDANFEKLYKSQPYADIPRRVAMADIAIDDRGVFVPPVVPRRRPVADFEIPTAD